MLVSCRQHLPLARILLVAGFLLRLFHAIYRYLNADEILHYLLSVQPSLAATYRASLTTAHPPLLIIFLHYWGALNHSELWLRLPSLLAGTAFAWIMYRWLKVVSSEATALIGLVLFLFSPPLVILSSEVRQYSLLLLFCSLSLYLFDCAIQRHSAVLILLSAASLYGALLTHYSSLIFALTLGIYALLRLINSRSRGAVVSAWVAGQLGAIAIIGFLFTHHVPMLRARGAPEGIAGTYLRHSVFKPGEDNVITFVARSNIRLFHYLFSQAAVGLIGMLLFMLGIVVLLRSTKQTDNHARTSNWQLAVLFCCPLIVNCGLAVFRVYPYGGTRHNSYLSIFALSGIAVALSQWRPQYIRQKLFVLGLLLLVCNFFPSPLGEYIGLRNQSRGQMAQAMNSLQAAPPGAIIFTDHQGGLQLSYYLCHDKAVQLAQPLSPLLSTTCDRFPLVSVGRWIFEGDSFAEDLRDAQKTDSWRRATRVYFFQAGWLIEKEPELREELMQNGCTILGDFGRNILACQLKSELNGTP